MLDTRPTYSGPDDPQVRAERHKPKFPAIECDVSLIPSRSHPNREFNQSFLEEWAVFDDQWLRPGYAPLFFVHCEAQSPGTARYFQQMLQQGVPVLFLEQH